MSFIPGVQAFKNWYYKPPEMSKEQRELYEAYNKTKQILTEEDKDASTPEIDPNLLVSSTETLDSPHVVINLKSQLRKQTIEAQVLELTRKATDHKTATASARVSPFTGLQGKILLRSFEAATLLAASGTVGIGVYSGVTSNGSDAIAAWSSTFVGGLASITGGIWYICQKADERAAEETALTEKQIEVLKSIADGEMTFLSGKTAATTPVCEVNPEEVVDKSLDASLVIFRDIDLESNPEIMLIQNEIEKLGTDEKAIERKKILTDRLAEIKKEIDELEAIRNKTVCRVIQKLDRNDPLLQSLHGVFENTTPAVEPLKSSTSMRKPTIHAKSTPITPPPQIRTRVQMKFSSAMTIAEAQKKQFEKVEDSDGYEEETIVLSTSPIEEDMDETSRTDLNVMHSIEVDNRIINFNRLCARLGYVPKQLYYKDKVATQV